MKRVSLAAAAALIASPAAARDTVGMFDGWGAFRDRQPARCYAIALPDPVRRGEWPAFAAISFWPASRVRGQFHTRLRRARAPDAPVTITIGTRRATLVAGKTDAWAANPQIDAAIVAAMRSGETMVIAGRDTQGRRFADAYPLKGAASAIDAAAIACSGR